MRPSSTDGHIRPARLDRPLHRGQTSSPGWGDPQLDRLVAEAAEIAREQARGQGYAVGWGQGRQAATIREHIDAELAAGQAARQREAFAARAQTLLGALASAAQAVQTSVAPAWTELADSLVDGALAIARAALGRELTTIDAEVAEAVRHAVRALAEQDDVVVHVNPGDLELLQALPGTDLPADAAQPPGGVAAQTPTQRVRVRLADAVTRAEEVLRS